MSKKRPINPNSRFEEYQWNQDFLRRATMATPPPTSSPSPHEQEESVEQEFSTKLTPLIEQGEGLVKEGQVWLYHSSPKNPEFSNFSNQLNSFVVRIITAATESELNEPVIRGLVNQLKQIHLQMEAAQNPPTPTVVAQPTPTTAPSHRPSQLTFPPFAGFNERYHTWYAKFRQFLERENPPEDVLLRWLLHELCPHLSEDHRSQLEFLPTSQEFLIKLNLIFGNARCAINAVRAKLSKLPSINSSKPESVLKFFDALQAIASDLTHLDKTFPDKDQPPSRGILCFCTMEILRGKLSETINTTLQEAVMEKGDFCSPADEFFLLLGQAEKAKKIAHYTMSSKLTTPTTNQQHSGKDKGNKSQTKAVKTFPQKSSPHTRSPSPRRCSPSPRRRSPSPHHRSSHSQQHTKKTIYPCKFCESTEHGTFSPECKLSRGQDPKMVEKLKKRRFCLRCLRTEDRCKSLPDTCHGFYINLKTRRKVSTDCHKCLVDGGKIHKHICGHFHSENTETMSKKAM